MKEKYRWFKRNINYVTFERHFKSPDTLRRKKFKKHKRRNRRRETKMYLIFIIMLNVKYNFTFKNN